MIIDRIYNNPTWLWGTVLVAYRDLMRWASRLSSISTCECAQSS
jgi:hypothetical protein